MGCTNPFGARPAQAAAAAQPGSPPASRKKSHLDLLQLTLATLMWFVSAQKMPYPAGIPGGTEPRARKKSGRRPPFVGDLTGRVKKSYCIFFPVEHHTAFTQHFERRVTNHSVSRRSCPACVFRRLSGRIFGRLAFWAFSSSVRLSVSRSAYSSVCHHSHNPGEAEDARPH